MGKTCSTNLEKRAEVRYYWERQKERNHSLNQDVGGLIILK
jgi:hypothetical protein